MLRLVFLATAFLVAGRGQAEEPAPAFELHDQFGKAHRIEFPRPDVLVLLLADREGSEQLEEWLRPLVERYGEDVEIHGVAKLAGVPLFLRPVLRSIFRSRVKAPVMMDWKGTISEHFDYEAGMANLLVFNPAGVLQYRVNGPASPGDLRQCMARIDETLEVSAPRAE